MLIRMIVSQLLAIGSLVIWAFVAGMSVMAFDEGSSPVAWTIVLTVWAYPLLPVLTGLTFAPPGIEAEEYAVYSALVRQNPIGYDLGSSIVVREQTVSDLGQFEQALEYHKRLPAQLVDSYRSRNARTYVLSPKLDIEQAYTMLTQVEFERIFLHRKGSVWIPFQEAYPEASGMIALSRVGFDKNGKVALAEFGFRCGDLCGAGGIYLLVKEDGHWTVQETLMVWQS